MLLCTSYVHTQCDHSTMSVLKWLRIVSDVTCQILPRWTHTCQLHYLVCCCLFAAAVYMHTYYVYTYSMMSVHLYTACTYSIISSHCAIISQALRMYIHISLSFTCDFLHYITQRGTVATVNKPQQDIQQDIQAEAYELYMSKTEGLCSRLLRCI
jgi:hypothetical protein